MKTIIYGNGAMAKVLYSYMKKDFDIAGFCVDSCCIKEKKFCGLSLVAFEKVETVFNPKKYNMINAIGFIEMNELREKKCEQSGKKGYETVSFIHPSVQIHDGVSIGKNCIILDFVSIHCGSKIGDGTFISSNVNIGHDCTIEPFNWINSGVSIAGNTKIGKGCFFGVNSSIGNDLSIGSKNFIAANVHINKNTLDNQTYLSQNAQLFKLDSKKFIRFAKIF